MHGITWLDCTFLILLVAFTVRGLLRGTIAQVFAFLGLLFGAWALLVVGHWVGLHWSGAKPAAVFAVIRWLVAALAGLAIAAIFQWWGDAVAKAVHEGPFNWFDRAGGGAIGAALGLAVVALAALLMLQGPVLSASGNVALHGRCSRPLVRGGATVTRLIRSRVPWGGWLHGQFLSASRRLDGAPARAATAGAH
jgi:uncharacterized membrane protein required for colicin V production